MALLRQMFGPSAEKVFRSFIFFSLYFNYYWVSGDLFYNQWRSWIWIGVMLFNGSAFLFVACCSLKFEKKVKRKMRLCFLLKKINASFNWLWWDIIFIIQTIYFWNCYLYLLYEQSSYLDPDKYLINFPMFLSVEGFYLFIWETGVGCATPPPIRLHPVYNSLIIYVVCGNLIIIR